ncbi:unnamed protein product [Penicillium salamii]|nr:unnamed protein product [Penicillium salamii]
MCTREYACRPEVLFRYLLGQVQEQGLSLNQVLIATQMNACIIGPKNWFREHPVLGKSFVFWVIVHGVADGAFKGHTTVTEVLAAKPPKGRESWALEWNETAKDLPFFRMVTSEGPKPTKALTFSSLRHNFTSLAQRDGFKDQLRVHGIRGGIANKIDRKCICAVTPQHY